MGVDERSLGFWALGFGRGSTRGLPAAVICSSGTAVANLLPAVVEASCGRVPLLLLTADRPYELRDTGANQTIDQVKIFGGYTRWASDVPAPSGGCDAPCGRSLLTAIDAAVRAACGAPTPGPVHLNMQFRDPLAPQKDGWNSDSMLAGLSRWTDRAEPFTTAVGSPASLQTAALLNESGASGAGSAELAGVLQLLLSARRGLLVVGEQPSAAGAAAAAALSALLGWPLAADVLSGLRVGAAAVASSSPSSAVEQQQQQSPRPLLLHHMDHLLLGDPASWWSELRPDVILQLGPRVTSKRVNSFMVRTQDCWLPVCPYMHTHTRTRARAHV